MVYSKGAYLCLGVAFWLSPKVLLSIESNNNSKAQHAQEASESQEEAEDFNEDGLYLINDAIPVSMPLTDRSIEGKLKKFSRIRIFEIGTLEDLCNADLCTDKAQGLILNHKGQKCAELSTEALAENACMSDEYFVIQQVEDPNYTNCFCTKTSHITNNISRIARVETQAMTTPVAPVEEGKAPPKTIKNFDANSVQFIALDDNGTKVYEGYVHAPTVAAVGSKKMKSDFAKLTQKYSKMEKGDYVFEPDYSKKFNGMVGGTLYRRLEDGSLQVVGLDFYTSRSNIPHTLSTANQDDGSAGTQLKKPEPAPSPAHKNEPKGEGDPKPPKAPPTNPSTPKAETNGASDLITNRPQDSKQSARHKEFVKKFHRAMKSLVYDVTHAESAVLANSPSGTLASIFDEEASDGTRKSSDEKGLCWRYVALGLQKSLGLNGGYLPRRPPVANKARDAFSVIKPITQKCPDGRTIPLFKYVEIPEKYRLSTTKSGGKVGISRNTLLIKGKNGKSPFQEFIDTQLQSGDVLVWGNPSSKRAGHIEAFFPELRSNGLDDAFFSDYRGDMDQKDGNPDRPGGRSTNTLKHIMRYNSC